MYGTGDALARLGHRVDYAFREQLGVRAPHKMRRFAVPPAIVGFVRSRHRAVRYDVVEIHEPLAAAYCFARRFDARLPPVVVFSHGLEDRGHAAELAYLRRKGFRPSLKQRISPLSVTWQAAYAVGHADHVVCLNTADRVHLERRGIARDDITVAHSGIDQALLAAGADAGAALESRPEAVLFLGTWILRKGCLDIAAAMSTVLQRNEAARLTIAGCHADAADVRTSFPPEFHARIEVIPHIDRTEHLAEIYARHSIFLLPSYYEGHPIAMVEAAAFGLAIVTTGICGMADFVSDGSNGRLVGVGHPQQLAHVVLELLAAPAECRRLGAAARQTAERHTWADAARPLLMAYELAARRASTHAERVAGDLAR
jgi:glycosyltransferase involved in cell wall biosynthesis